MQRQRHQYRLTWWLLAILPIAFLGLFFLWPLVTVLTRGLIADGHVDVVGMLDVLQEPRSGRVVVTTVWLAFLGTVGSILIGVPAAYALFRLRWRGQRVVRALATVPFVLPTVVVAAAFSALMRPSGLLGHLGLDQSVAAIAMALVFYNITVVLRVVGGAWSAMDSSTVAAARVLGASRWRAFRSVTLPALTPAIASAGAIVFLFCATSFGVVLVLGGTRVNTVETEIYLQVNQFLDLRAAAVLSLLQLVIVAVTLWVADLTRKRRERALPGRRLDGTRRAHRRDVPLVAGIIAVLAVVLAAPLYALVERSLRTASGHGLDHYFALFQQPGRAILAVPVAEAAVNSLVTATIAALMATGLGVIVTHLVTHRSRRTTLLDTFVMLPLGVSAVMVGLGMLITLNRPIFGITLGGSWWLVAIAQAVVALPLVVRSLVPTARAIDPRLRLAASALGASPWRVWRRVDWPLLRGAVGLSFGFAFAIALGEFGATSFLARPDRPTLPTAIYRLLGRPGIENIGMAFAASVLLAVLTAAVMMASERMRTQVGADL
jgi:thiamine transport system permease protein